MKILLCNSYINVPYRLPCQHHSGDIGVAMAGVAVTKTGTGAYKIASGSLAGFKAELATASATPILPATFDAATSTLRT
jgi:hypothetical protein